MAILIDQLSRFDSKQKAIAGGATQFGADWQATTQQFSVKMQGLEATTQALGIKLGNVLIPILEKVMTKIAEVVGWLDKHKAAAEALAIVAGGVLVAGIAAWTASLFVAGGALAFVTAEMVIATGGLLLLVPALVLLVTHWSQTWATIKSVTDDAVKFLRGPMGTLVQIITLGPFAIMTTLALHWQTVWNAMRTVAGTAVQFIIGSVIKPLVDAFLNMAQNIVGAAASAFGWVPGLGGKLKAARDAINDFVATTNASLSGLAASAGGWGNEIGSNLGAGLNTAIRANIPSRGHERQPVRFAGDRGHAQRRRVCFTVPEDDEGRPGSCRRGRGRSRPTSAGHPNCRSHVHDLNHQRDGRHDSRTARLDIRVGWRRGHDHEPDRQRVCPDRPAACGFHSLWTPTKNSVGRVWGSERPRVTGPAKHPFSLSWGVKDEPRDLPKPPSRFVRRTPERQLRVDDRLNLPSVRAGQAVMSAHKPDISPAPSVVGLIADSCKTRTRMEASTSRLARRLVRRHQPRC